MEAPARAVTPVLVSDGCPQNLRLFLQLASTQPFSDASSAAVSCINNVVVCNSSGMSALLACHGVTALLDLLEVSHAPVFSSRSCSEPTVVWRRARVSSGTATPAGEASSHHLSSTEPHRHRFPAGPSCHRAPHWHYPDPRSGSIATSLIPRPLP